MQSGVVDVIGKLLPGVLIERLDVDVEPELLEAVPQPHLGNCEADGLVDLAARLGRSMHPELWE